MRPCSGWEVLTTCRTCCHAVQMREVVLQAAAGLHALGLRKGDHVSLFSENSAKWLVAEQGCAKNGVTTAVRGATAPVDELQYIYNHSDSKAVVLQVRQRRLPHHHPSARFPSARLPVAEYGGLCPVLLGRAGRRAAPEAVVSRVAAVRLRPTQARRAAQVGRTGVHGRIVLMISFLMAALTHPSPPPPLTSPPPPTHPPTLTRYLLPFLMPLRLAACRRRRR